MSKSKAVRAAQLLSTNTPVEHIIKAAEQSWMSQKVKEWNDKFDQSMRYAYRFFAPAPKHYVGENWQYSQVDKNKQMPKKS